MLNFNTGLSEQSQVMNILTKLIIHQQCTIYRKKIHILHDQNNTLQLQGAHWLTDIVEMQNICNLIGWNGVNISEFLIASAQIPVECETEEIGGIAFEFTLT